MCPSEHKGRSCTADPREELDYCPDSLSFSLARSLGQLRACRALPPSLPPSLPPALPLSEQAKRCYRTGNRYWKSCREAVIDLVSNVGTQPPRAKKKKRKTSLHPWASCNIETDSCNIETEHACTTPCTHSWPFPVSPTNSSSKILASRMSCRVPPPLLLLLLLLLLLSCSALHVRALPTFPLLSQLPR